MNLSRVDHIIYGTPDLDTTVEDLAVQFGVRASVGGQHPGEGTRNALYSLGPSRYLELMGPDPDQPEPDRPRWVGIDDLSEPRIVAWAAKATRLDIAVKEGRNRGVALGDVLEGGRTRPDGTRLSWRLTDPRSVVGDRIVPFLIDWGDTPHPSSTAASGVSLNTLGAEHPEAGKIGAMLEALGLDLTVRHGESPCLIAELQTPNGVIKLA
jgi:hypothetical protein